MIAIGNDYVLVTKSGAAILVSAEDLPLLQQYTWRAERTGQKFYAIADGENGPIYMHRLLLGLNPDDIRMGDHDNGCSLDNRRPNLKVVTAQQNCWTARHSRRNSTGFAGVSYHASGDNYQARIYVNGQRESLGYFSTAEAAGAAYATRAARVQDDVMRGVL